MKRDPVVVRNVLLAIEEGAGTFSSRPAPPLQAWVNYISLLREAGLVGAIDATTSVGPEWRAVELTWKGHDLLELMRDDTVFDAVLSKSSCLDFELLTSHLRGEHEDRYGSSPKAK